VIARRDGTGRDIGVRKFLQIAYQSQLSIGLHLRAFCLFGIVIATTILIMRRPRLPRRAAVARVHDEVRLHQITDSQEKMRWNKSEEENGG
jgi:hypothetical protein